VASEKAGGSKRCRQAGMKTIKAEEKRDRMKKEQKGVSNMYNGIYEQRRNKR